MIYQLAVEIENAKIQYGHQNSIFRKKKKVKKGAYLSDFDLLNTKICIKSGSGFDLSENSIYGEIVLPKSEQYFVRTFPIIPRPDNHYTIKCLNLFSTT